MSHFIAIKVGWQRLKAELEGRLVSVTSDECQVSYFSETIRDAVGRRSCSRRPLRPRGPLRGRRVIYFLHSTPIQSNPIQSNPIQSYPILSYLIQSGHSSLGHCCNLSSLITISFIVFVIALTLVRSKSKHHRQIIALFIFIECLFYVRRLILCQLGMIDSLFDLQSAYMPCL